MCVQYFLHLKIHIIYTIIITQLLSNTFMEIHLNKVTRSHKTIKITAYF